MLTQSTKQNMLTQTQSTTSLAYFKTEVKFDYLTAINMSGPLFYANGNLAVVIIGENKQKSNMQTQCESQEVVKLNSLIETYKIMSLFSGT